MRSTGYETMGTIVNVGYKNKESCVNILKKRTGTGLASCHETLIDLPNSRHYALNRRRLHGSGAGTMYAQNLKQCSKGCNSGKS